LWLPSRGWADSAGWWGRPVPGIPAAGFPQARCPVRRRLGASPPRSGPPRAVARERRPPANGTQPPTGTRHSITTRPSVLSSAILSTIFSGAAPLAPTPATPQVKRRAPAHRHAREPLGIGLIRAEVGWAVLGGRCSLGDEPDVAADGGRAARGGPAEGERASDGLRRAYAGLPVSPRDVRRPGVHSRAPRRPAVSTSSRLRGAAVP